MGLPADLLRELLTMLKTDATRVRVSDKRTAPRVGVRSPVRILPVGDTGEPTLCWVKNLSGVGIGLLGKQSMPCGTEFVIPFKRAEAAQGPLRVLYRVANVKRISPELFAIGGRMVCVVEEIKARS
ncbi:MAG TPA: hypothetical protein VFE58_20035 [Tepidisphaeraceae bacterium]|jgi:hypothetical protein|nr:hypothetical protein [Tepidisphaeraceae bacterium]